MTSDELYERLLKFAQRSVDLIKNLPKRFTTLSMVVS